MSMHDIEDGEAMSAVEGGALSDLLGVAVIDMQKEPQRAAFNAYRVAFRQHEADPTPDNKLQRDEAFAALRTAMGIAP